MTTITIERELIEQALNALTLPCDRWNRQQFMIVKAATKSLEAALAAPATAPEQMPLERDCICHQDLHIDGYSGGAAPEGLYGALWVVVEGVGKKYVLADQSSEPKDMPAPATAPAQPAWHDAPTVPGIWLCDEGDICYTWTAHNIEILDQFDPGDGLRWYGPIQEDKP